MSSLPSSPQFEWNLPDEIDLRTVGDVAYQLADRYKNPEPWTRSGDDFLRLLSNFLPAEYLELKLKKPIPRDVFLEAVRKIESQL